MYFFTSQPWFQLAPHNANVYCDSDVLVSTKGYCHDPHCICIEET